MPRTGNVRFESEPESDAPDDDPQTVETAEAAAAALDAAVSEAKAAEAAAATAASTRPPSGVVRRRLQRPHTAAVGTAAALSSAAAPFLDSSGNRTQPSRDGSNNNNSGSNNNKKKRRKKRRPKTAIGIEQHPQRQSAVSQAAGGSEPNFPTLNPRVFHALRGFLTPESLRKTKFYSDREDRMSVRREQLTGQQNRLSERIGVFYRRLDTFIAETKAAADWEPEDRRKQKSLLDDLDNL